MGARMLQKDTEIKMGKFPDNGTPAPSPVQGVTYNGVAVPPVGGIVALVSTPIPRIIDIEMLDDGGLRFTFDRPMPADCYLQTGHWWNGSSYGRCNAKSTTPDGNVRYYAKHTRWAWQDVNENSSRGGMDDNTAHLIPAGATEYIMAADRKEVMCYLKRTQCHYCDRNYLPATAKKARYAAQDWENTQMRYRRLKGWYRFRVINYVKGTLPAFGEPAAAIIHRVAVMGMGTTPDERNEPRHKWFKIV